MGGQANAGLEVAQPTNGSNYVFLQRFGLGIPTPNITFHTEVLVCPKSGFSQADQVVLDGIIAALTDFTEIDLSWWSQRTAQCVELGYGGAFCNKECCGVPHGPSRRRILSMHAGQSSATQMSAL